MARDTKISESLSDPGSSSFSLVRRLKDGSSGAWNDLTSLYGPLVVQWCRRSNVADDATADIAQEIFLSAFRSLHRFDPTKENATFRGWLWTIARNRIADHFRRTNFDLLASGGSTANIQVQQIPDHVLEDEPSEPDDLGKLTARVMKRVRVDFKDQSWQMFLDVTVQGHPTDVVAERFGVSTAAVRQTRSRILRRLRQELGDVL